MAISAVVAVGDAANPLIARLKQKALEIKVGPGSDASSDMGPVVSAQARDRIVGYFARGSAAGATIVVDGPDCTVDSSPDGFFVGPTLFDHVVTKDGYLHRRDLGARALRLAGRHAQRGASR
jgi:malonate-semialdehyde dehydrogenase (acetylating) / methylmalonate-semialdehyde dehydrogenase